MSATPSWPPDDLPLRVEAACTRFEDAWKAAQAPNQRPHIETYLNEFAPEEHPLAVAELVPLDLDYRTIHGERPAIADYLGRFPGHAELIQRAFDELATSPSAAPVSIPITRDGSPCTLSDPRQATVDPTEDLPIIPGYELVGVLGEGGQSKVFKAWQQRPRRLVALKMLRDGELAGPNQFKRFRLEAEAIAQLHHPHIVQVFDVGDFKGQPYFALEFVEGGDLAQKLHGTPQPPRQAAALTELLALAVEYAHKHFIVHRDLKPKNVLLTADNQPKITDFGLAKRTYALGEQVSESLETQTGAILGTPSYMAPEQAAGAMAPEQAAGAKGLTTAVDVYGLGAILYELLTGRPPFKAATPMQTIHQVLHEEPLPPRRLRKQVPRDLETICLKCLRKEPDRRYASAAALADDLHRFLAGETIQARPAGVWERGVKWARRRPAVAALLGVGVAAVVGLWIAMLSFNEHLRNKVKEEKQLLEAALLREQSEKLNIEVQKKLIAAAAALDVGQAHKARDLSEEALEIIKEQDLAELRPQAETLHAKAVAAVRRQKADKWAGVKYDNFLVALEEALSRAGFFLGEDAPARAQAARDAANKALDVLEVHRGEAPEPDLIPEYTPEQKSRIRAGRYAMLLVLADSVGQAEPGEKSAREALEYLNQAKKLSGATHALHVLSAQYLDQLGEARAAAKARKMAGKPTDALDFCLLDRERLRQGNNVQAIQDFQAALEKQRGYFWARYLLAVAHFRTRNYDAALASLEDLPSTTRRSPVVKIVRGSVYGELSRFEEAEHAFKQALDDVDEAPDVWTRYAVYVNRGATRVGRHDFARAICDLEAAKELQPNRAAAYVNLAQACRGQGQGQAVLARCIPFPGSWPIAAQAYLERENWLRWAGEQLNRAIEIDKQQPELYRFRARLHRDCNEPGDALWALETAIHLSRPGLAEDQAEKGRILVDLRRYAEACDAFETSLALRNHRPATCLELANAHWLLAEQVTDRARKHSEYEAAVEAFSRYLSSPAPESPRAAGRVHRIRGLLRLKLKDPAKALGDFSDALRVEKDAELYALSGWTNMALKLPGNARQDFDDALRLDPDHDLALRGRGLVRVKSATTMDDVQLALGDVEHIFKAPPDRAQLHDSARVYAQAALRVAQLRPLDRHRKSFYEQIAVGLLKRAVYSIDEPPAAHWDYWQESVLHDPELEPIRGATGFRDLTRELFFQRGTQ